MMQSEKKPSRKFIVLSKEIKTPFLMIYLVSLLTSLISLTLYFRIQPEIPIFYSLAQPAEQLAAKEWIFLFPAISIFISVAHSLLLRLINKSEKLIRKLFAWTTVVVQLMLLLAMLRILYIIS